MEDSARISAIVNRLQGFAGRDAACTALFGFAVGAAYALQQAVQLSFEDRVGQCPADYVDNLHRVIGMAARLGGVDKSDPVASAWLGGFFFNSALHRIAALNERLGKYDRSGRDRTPLTRREVNRLKHHVIGVDDGRTVPRRRAISDLEILADALLGLAEAR